MKVRLTRNPAANLNCNLKEGETGTVNAELGELLVRLGIAEQLEEPKQTVKGVSPEPAIGKSKKSQIKGSNQ